VLTISWRYNYLEYKLYKEQVINQRRLVLHLYFDFTYTSGALFYSTLLFERILMTNMKLLENKRQAIMHCRLSSCNKFEIAKLGSAYLIDQASFVGNLFLIRTTFQEKFQGNSTFCTFGFPVIYIVYSRKSKRSFSPFIDLLINPHFEKIYRQLFRLNNSLIM